MSVAGVPLDLDERAELESLRIMLANNTPGDWTYQSGSAGEDTPGATQIVWRHAPTQRNLVLDLSPDGEWEWFWSHREECDFGGCESDKEASK